MSGSQADEVQMAAEIAAEELSYGGYPGGNYSIEAFETHGSEPQIYVVTYDSGGHHEPVFSLATLFVDSMPTAEMAAAVIRHAGASASAARIEEFRQRFPATDEDWTRWTMSAQELDDLLAR